jgi:hypothetical protein
MTSTLKLHILKTELIKTKTKKTTNLAPVILMKNPALQAGWFFSAATTGL